MTSQKFFTFHIRPSNKPRFYIAPMNRSMDLYTFTVYITRNNKFFSGHFTEAVWEVGRLYVYIFKYST